MHEMVKDLSEIVVHSLPNFWRIAKNYMDGRYKKVRALLWFPLNFRASFAYLSTTSAGSA